MVRVSARVQELKRICWLIVAGLLTACSPAPPFTDSQNQPVALADFAGKPLLVNYFAPGVLPACGRYRCWRHWLGRDRSPW